MNKNYQDFDGYKPVAIPRAFKVIKGNKELNRLETMKTVNNNVQIVRLEGKKFVGIAVTSPFQNVMGIGETKRLFEASRNDIPNTVDADEYTCLHFANEVVFTYIYCMEVSVLDTIPEGFIGFAVPSSRYVKVRTKDEDPYGLIHTFISEHGIERNPNLFSLEVFKFGEEESKYNADILVPIMN